MENFVAETFFEDLFSQLPDVLVGSKMQPVRYGWGSQEDCNLYLSTLYGTKYPLIWLVQDKTKGKSTEASRHTRLIIAKASEHKTSNNVVVWNSEFKDVLNPLFVNVLKCLQQNGIAFISNQEYDVYREANYCESRKQKDGSTESFVIDHWNVIIFDALINFTGATNCIQTINF